MAFSGMTETLVSNKAQPWVRRKWERYSHISQSITNYPLLLGAFRETRHLYGKLSNCKLQLYPKPTHPTTLTVNPYSEFSRFFYCMFYMQSFPGFTHMYYLFKFPRMYYSFPGFNQTVRYIFPDFPNL